MPLHPSHARSTASDALKPLRDALPLALGFALFKLLLHFAMTLWSVHLGYGYFRDEFYYVMCGRRLAWGYVDHGPLVAVQARLGEMLFGDSVFGLRVLSELAGSLAVGLTGLLCAAFGGSRRAQVFAMVCLLTSGVYLAIDSFLSMNSWEPVFWGCTVLGLRMLWMGARPAPVWIGIGAAIGLGLLNKPSMLFFLVCLLLGLLLTPDRRLLWSRWAAAGVLLATALALPLLVWQMTHSMAMLEFLQRGATIGKVIVLGPWEFFLAQMQQMNPATLPVWIAGIVSLLWARTIQGGRAFGIAALLFYPLMFFMHAKDYYLAPIYPLLMAAGAVALAKWLLPERERPLGRIGFFGYEGLIGMAGIVLAPAAVPLLSPPAYIAYTKALGAPKMQQEVMKSGPLPEFYADHLGWDEEIAAVTAAAAKLTPEERARAAIVTENYGEAASLEFLGRDLPQVISGHNNYYLWGPHDRHNGPLIMIKSNPEVDWLKECRSVQPVARLDDPYTMLYEHKTIYILRDCSRDMTRDWAQEKNYL